MAFILRSSFKNEFEAAFELISGGPLNKSTGKIKSVMIICLSLL